MSDTTAETAVSITIDGRQIEARPGELVIDAAERTGTYIPRFCYHHRMDPVGMCRMCLVDIDSGRGPALQPSCMVTVTPDMTVETETPRVKKAQEGILEFLLINHPLDCPVCDKGGECPLQDHAMSYGPGESRFVEEKRHYEKPISISDNVYLDRERCILCDRFKARPWDLDVAESTCTGCSVGCRIAVDASRDRVLRFMGVDSEPVNWSWLCDKGRFGFEALGSEDRLTAPLMKVDGQEGHREVRWTEALGAAAKALRSGLDTRGAEGVAVIGGSRLTNEAAYAWTKLAKGVIGTDSVDAQLGDGLPAEVIAGLPRATIEDACTPGGTVLVIGSDLKDELPVLFLRVRDAVTRRRTTLVELAPRQTSLQDLAAHSIRHTPGAVHEKVAEILAAATDGDGDLAAAGRALAAGPLTVILGRGSVAESEDATVAAASALLSAFPDVRFLSAVRRGNVHGAMDAGMAPGMLPGQVSLAEGADWFREAWGRVPEATGLDTAGILEAAASGRIDTLIMLGADPLGDFPDAMLARRGLAGARTVIAVDTFANDTTAVADVVLPAAAFTEVDGTTTNLEGRLTVLNQKVTPPGSARPDWMIAAELTHLLGGDLGFTSVDEIFAEVQQLSTAHAGITLAELASEADGVLVGRPDRARSQRRPAMVQFLGADHEAPSLDAYSLRLVTRRKLFDRGTQIGHAPALAGLAGGSTLSVNPDDLTRIGISDGTRVKVTSSRGSLVAPATFDATVPAGTVVLHWNLGDPSPRGLIDATAAVTEVRVETTS